jgi:hypothetical protein
VNQMAKVVYAVGTLIPRVLLNQLTVDLRVKIDTIQLKYSQTKD